jgi:ABC-type multidrug transport system ATPase subunit
VPLLVAVDVRIEPGKVVAIIGASGAGKTTLLETLAGLRHTATGTVTFDGWDVRHHRDAFRSAVGYVPQADIIHTELAVRSTILHAARLRLPHLDSAAIDEVVDRTIETLGLSARADTVVGRLSGGQRKRVSIAVELLSRPRACFLDEPTSGLDPGTSRDLLRTLRALAADGSTVVLTTHNPDDVMACDEVIVLARGGRVVFQGSPKAALWHFGVDDVAGVYSALDASSAVVSLPARPADMAGRATADRPPEPSKGGSFAQQWKVLARRDLEVLVRNPLTIAIMLGAPALVVAMMVILFRSGAFDVRGGEPEAAISITYWLAFAAFFFGLTYGLLQVCTEIAVVRRERHVGMRLSAYLVAKLTVLIPILLAVNVIMVAAMVATDRLPHARWRTDSGLLAVLVLDAVAALALGLLASAAVRDPSQATLALPMLCFPAVLFGGAVLPTHTMATAGRAISAVTADRWAFEALGRVLGLSSRFAAHPDAASLRRLHGDAFVGAIGAHLVILAAFTAAFLALAVRVLRRRTAIH